MGVTVANAAILEVCHVHFRWSRDLIMESFEPLSWFYLRLSVGLLSDGMKTFPHPVARTKVDRTFTLQYASGGVSQISEGMGLVINMFSISKVHTTSKFPRISINEWTTRNMMSFLSAHLHLRRSTYERKSKVYMNTKAAMYAVFFIHGTFQDFFEFGIHKIFASKHLLFSFPCHFCNNNTTTKANEHSLCWVVIYCN